MTCCSFVFCLFSPPIPISSPACFILFVCLAFPPSFRHLQPPSPSLTTLTIPHLHPTSPSFTTTTPPSHHHHPQQPSRNTPTKNVLLLSLLQPHSYHPPCPYGFSPHLPHPPHRVGYGAPGPPRQGERVTVGVFAVSLRMTYIDSSVSFSHSLCLCSSAFAYTSPVSYLPV